MEFLFCDFVLKEIFRVLCGSRLHMLDLVYLQVYYLDKLNVSPLKRCNKNAPRRQQPCVSNSLKSLLFISKGTCLHAHYLICILFHIRESTSLLTRCNELFTFITNWTTQNKITFCYKIQYQTFVWRNPFK